MEFLKILSVKGKYYVISQGDFYQYRKRLNDANPGLEADSIPGSIFEFFPADAIIKKITDLPNVKCFFGATLLNNKIYIAGGYDTQWNELRGMDVFDIVTGKWEELTSLLIPRSRMAFEAIDKKIYAFYGTANEKAYEVYTPAEDIWEPLMPRMIPSTMNKIETCAASVVIENKLFIIAPYGKGFYEYDPIENILYEKSQPQFQSEYFDAVSMNKKIYVGGGTNTDSFNNNIYMYNPYDGLWKNVGKLTTPRCRAGLLYYNSMLMFLGGSLTDMSKPAQVTDEIFIYIPTK
jgi:N-acetylneuraminic acid mutarotase